MLEANQNKNNCLVKNFLDFNLSKKLLTRQFFIFRFASKESLFFVFDREASLTRSQERFICCRSWKTVLKSGHLMHCQQIFPENSGNHSSSVSTKLAEFKTCPLNLSKSQQRVHEKSGIHSVSKNFVGFSSESNLMYFLL